MISTGGSKHTALLLHLPLLLLLLLLLLPLRVSGVPALSKTHNRSSASGSLLRYM